MINLLLSSLKTSTILKRFLFIFLLALSIRALEAADCRLTILSRTSLDSSTPEFQQGFTTLVEAQVEGLPTKFYNGDIIKTESISLSPTELLHLKIITPHSYKSGPYFNVHDLSFRISNAHYDDSSLKIIDSKKVYWGLLKPVPTFLKYQYESSEASEIDEDSLKMEGRTYHPLIITATLYIPVNDSSSALDDGSRL